MMNSESRKREAAQVVAPDVETLADWLASSADVALDWLADHDARLRESIAAEIEARDAPWPLNPALVPAFKLGIEHAARIARATR